MLHPLSLTALLYGAHPTPEVALSLSTGCSLEAVRKQSPQRRVTIALLLLVSMLFRNVFRPQSLVVWSMIIANPMNEHGEGLPSLEINRFESNIIILPGPKYIEYIVSYGHLHACDI